MERHAGRGVDCAFDLKTAKETAESFSAACLWWWTAAPPSWPTGRRLSKQQDIGVCIQQLKLEGASGRYPLHREMVRAITEVDQPTAQRLLNEQIGESFNSYLSALCISRGRAMLLNTDAFIAEICGRCGFDDQSYFTKVFRKYTGVTPGRFRERRGRPEVEKRSGEEGESKHECAQRNFRGNAEGKAKLVRELVAPALG